MSNMPPSDLAPIQQLIDRTRRLLRSSWMITGMAVVCTVLLGSLLVAATADLLLALWPSFRWVALAIVVIPAGWAFIMGVLRAGLRRLGSRNVARKIENHIPQMHNRLVSCMDLAAERDGHPLSRGLPPAARRRNHGAGPRFRSAAGARLAADAPGFARRGDCGGRVRRRLDHAFRKTHRRQSPACSALGPTSRRPRECSTRSSPATHAILRGDPIEFVVDVKAGAPTDLQLEIFAKDGGAPLRYDLRRRNDRRWTFSLNGFERSFDYRVRGGGTWTLPFHIAMVDRPKLVSLQATLHYAKYFGPVEPRPNPPQVADIAGPEQSEVEVAVGVEGDVARGEIRLYQARPPPAARRGQARANRRPADALDRQRQVVGPLPLAARRLLPRTP